MSPRRPEPRWTGGLRLTAAVVTTLWAAASGAQTTEDKAAADALFDAARQAMNAKDYATACPKFADSQKLDPGVGTLLNLARCYDLSGRTSSAYSTYREAAALARAEGQDEREQFARSEVARLEGTLTRLVLVVGAETEAIDGLTIRRAGQEIPRTMWGVPVPVDPGPQQIEISAPGYQTRTAEVNAQGHGTTINLAVPSLEPVRAAAAPPPPAPSDAPAAEPEKVSEPEQAPQEVPPPAIPEDAATRAGPGVGPWILGGAGLAAIGVGTAFSLIGLKENNKAKDICTDLSVVCSGSNITAWWNARNAAETDYTIAYIGWGVGAAALVGSAIWMIAGRPKSHASGVQVTPVASQRELGLIVGGRF